MTSITRAMSQIDRQIAALLRENRLSLGLTQEAAGALVGVTYQQFHKYEAGYNRISSGRLYRIAESFQLPVSRFFPTNGYTPVIPAHTNASLRLLRDFNRLSLERRQVLSELASVLANPPSQEPSQ